MVVAAHNGTCSKCGILAVSTGANLAPGWRPLERLPPPISWILMLLGGAAAGACRPSRVWGLSGSLSSTLLSIGLAKGRVFEPDATLWRPLVKACWAHVFGSTVRVVLGLAGVYYQCTTSTTERKPKGTGAGAAAVAPLASNCSESLPTTRTTH